MKILVVGEGKHDIGARVWREKEKCYADEPGWLQALIRRIAKPGLDFTITAIRRSDIKLTDVNKRKLMPLPEGHGAKALAAMQKAIIEDYNVVIFMADLDSNQERDWDQHIKYIHLGYSRISSDKKITGIACLPKSTSESWILSDVDAWIQSGLEEEDAAALRALPPETLWGTPSDPKGNHPKQVFNKFKAKLRGSRDETALRVEIISASTPNNIISRCSVSFAGFMKECKDAGICP